MTTTQHDAETIRAKADQARAALNTPSIVHIAVYGLVQLWKLDPEAAFSIADASRLSAELKEKISAVPHLHP